MLMYKNSFIKIKKSLGRFFSIVFIVALGCAFFSGVRETSNDMIKSMDAYYDKANLMDYRIVSTMGLTEDDITALKKIPDVLCVEGVYSCETIANGFTSKIYSLGEQINHVELKSGRMPSNRNEILVEDGTFKIGETITVEAEENVFKANSFEVVGTITSPLYIYQNKGISTVGDGSLDTYMYVLPDAFSMEVFTEIYLTANETLNATSYLSDYDKAVEKLDHELSNLKPIRETARYEEIVTEAMQKVYEAEEQLNQKKEEANAKFDHARGEIEKNREKLQDAKNTYHSGMTKLQNTKKSMENTFFNTEKTLAENKRKLDESLNSYQIKKENLNENITTLESQIEQLKTLLAKLPEGSAEAIACQEKITTFEKYLVGLKQVQSGYEQIEIGYRDLDHGKVQWNNEYQSNLNQLNNAHQQIITAESKLKSAEEEYHQNYQTFEEEIQKAQDEIDNARQEVLSLEKPTWYLFNREDNTGYTIFYDSATKIDAIASVFPLFFILIAILMCMNTMTRMIEEERGEIGLFSSLGYRKGSILTSYILYVSIATFIGLVVGLLIGYFAVPHAVYGIYTAQFIMPPLITYFNIPASIIIILVAFTTMILVTSVTVLSNFKHMPANLLRPPVLKKGKKVILEYIPFLWKRFSFSWKVSIRNLFLYKKRIIMTLIGISGCTALLLTGFGIKDSLKILNERQFETILKYDAALILEEDTKIEEISPILKENQVTDFVPIYTSTFTFEADKKNLDVTLFTFENQTNIDSYVALQNEEGALTLNEKGVIITQKMAELLDAKVGSMIQIRNSDNQLFVLQVDAITENYVNHYIYMNEDYHKKVFEELSYNAILTNLPEGKAKEIGENLIKNDRFMNISYTEDNMKMFHDVVSSMNDIVFLIIGFSTFLAITVLYNLTTINISERKREIATLKVLGFHDKEVSSYVYRETLILTLVGIAIGLLLGVGLNSFILLVGETDDLLLIDKIDCLSYLYTLIIMIVFTIIVRLIAYFILKAIDMLDSLKSVE